MLTARDDVSDRIRGLDAGADDYLVKPFDFGELLARLRALIRRGPTERPSVLTVGDLRIDPAKRVVTRAGNEVELTPREFALLEFLARHAGDVVSQGAAAGARLGRALRAVPRTSWTSTSATCGRSSSARRAQADPHGARGRLPAGGGVKFPIRVRLTAWYALVLAGIIVVLGGFVVLQLRLRPSGDRRPRGASELDPDRPGIHGGGQQGLPRRQQHGALQG